MGKVGKIQDPVCQRKAYGSKSDDASGDDAIDN